MSRKLHDALIADVLAGLLVLRDRDGLPITHGQAMERARNIVAALVGNYEVKALDNTNGGDTQ